MVKKPYSMRVSAAIETKKMLRLRACEYALTRMKSPTGEYS